MKKLTLTNAEYIHLKEIYQTELEKAQKRIEHLTAILKKLETGVLSSTSDELKPDVNTKDKVILPSVNPDDKPRRGRKPKAKVEVSIQKPKSRRGRKPKSDKELKALEDNTLAPKRRIKKPIKKGVGKKKVKWNDFIMNFITNSNVAHLSSDITKKAAEHFKIKEGDFPRMRLVISGALSKLVTNEKKLQAEKIEGSREKYYGLTEWFDENKKLLPKYSPVK